VAEGARVRGAVGVDDGRAVVLGGAVLDGDSVGDAVGLARGVAVATGDEPAATTTVPCMNGWNRQKYL
jgi:hypothetical protein